MTDVKRDANNVPGMLAVLDSDGSTKTPVKATASSHALNVSDGSSGSDNGPSPARALKDSNYEDTLIAQDSSGNLIPLYVDSSGQLLIKST